MSDILRISDLNVTYHIPEGNRHVLRDVSLSLQRGQIRAVVGESGCGKSTLVNTLISLLPSNARIVSGSILLDGIEMNGLKERELRQIRFSKMGVVFQDPFSALDPLFTVEKQARETLEIANRFTGTQATARIRGLLAACGISNPDEIMKKYPHELSGGLRQRVMIALALLNDPKLLIADEPTTALDVTIQKEILQLLRKLARERDLTVLFITHSLDVAAEIADSISVFYGGRVVEEGKVEEIFRFPRHPYTQALLKTIPSLRYGKNQRKLMPIEGEMFSFTDETSGCPFAPRCPYAVDRCFSSQPETKTYGGHSFACLMDEVL